MVMATLLLVCMESGKMFSFGSNKYGELGLSDGGPQATFTPTLVESIKSSVVRVACGRLHSAAIDSECHTIMYVKFKYEYLLSLSLSLQSRDVSGCGAGVKEVNLGKEIQRTSKHPL